MAAEVATTRRRGLLDVTELTAESLNPRALITGLLPATTVSSGREFGNGSSVWSTVYSLQVGIVVKLLLQSPGAAPSHRHPSARPLSPPSSSVRDACCGRACGWHTIARLQFPDAHHAPDWVRNVVSGGALCAAGCTALSALSECLARRQSKPQAGQRQLFLR